jgi:hypothetical protein
MMSVKSTVPSRVTGLGQRRWLANLVPRKRVWLPRAADLPWWKERIDAAVWLDQKPLFYYWLRDRRLLCGW